MRYLGSASEHVVYDPATKTVIDEYIRDIKSFGYVYAGYAWFNESGKWDDTEVPVAFIVDKKGDYLIKDPCWNWIKKERTAEQQQWIEDNWDKIVEAWDNRS